MALHRDEATIDPRDHAPRARAVLAAFFRLGLTSFGGPTAHIGYFRSAFVQERRWLEEDVFAQYFAFASLLPGPTSSQLGMLIGLHRAGPLGAGAAWLGFTLPSALFMAVAGLIGLGLEEGRAGWLAGLAAAAVGVVAWAVWGMAKGLLPDWPRRGIALAGFAVTALVAGAPGQFLTLGLGAAAGALLLRDRLPPPGELAAAPVPAWFTTGARVGFVAVMAAMATALVVGAGGLAGLAAGIVYAGTFIVGGGHVVLPLLETTVVEPGHVGPELFLAGYGLAQAVPGPLFTIGAFLGAAAPAGGVIASLVCLVAIFLPSTLLMFAVLPAWRRVQGWPAVRPALFGMGAAVTGLLAAALVVVLIPAAITSPGTAAVALAVLGLVASGRVPAWLTVLAAAAGGAALDVAGLM
jgi:chromate transporter